MMYKRRGNSFSHSDTKCIWDMAGVLESPIVGRNIHDVHVSQNCYKKTITFVGLSVGGPGIPVNTQRELNLRIRPKWYREKMCVSWSPSVGRKI